MRKKGVLKMRRVDKGFIMLRKLENRGRATDSTDSLRPCNITRFYFSCLSNFSLQGEKRIVMKMKKYEK